MITTVCKISYGSQTVPPIVPAVQGDTGRAISFEIADFTPPAGATATYFILKPSGEAIYNSATITDNSILCELTAQSLAEAGENRMQVRVLQGEDIVTSFEVILMVRTFLGDDAMESGTEMNIFDQAVAQATEQFQENAEQIVQQVIESIPADYTELTEEVDELNERILHYDNVNNYAFSYGGIYNGSINSDTNRIHTDDLIRVHVGTIIKTSADFSNIWIAKYNLDKTYKGNGDWVTSFTADWEGYVRIVMRKTAGNAQIGAADFSDIISTAEVLYNYVRDYNDILVQAEDTASKANLSNNLLNEYNYVASSELTEPLNLFDKNATGVTRNGYYDRTNSFVSSTTLGSTDYIKVIPGLEYYTNLPGNHFVLWYDSNKTFITYTNVTGSGTFTPVTDAAYVKTLIVLADINSLKVNCSKIQCLSPEKSAYYGLNGVAFGTSLTYRAQTTGGYLQYLPAMSGITFDNQGIGSATILSNGTQPAMLPVITGYTGYSGKRVCLLEGFCNDWYYNASSLGTWKDTTQDTVCGCVRYALNYILTQNPDLTVFLILDHFGKGISAPSAVNSAGQTQLEFYQEIEKVALSMGIRVIREYELSEISNLTPQYLLDNIHLNTLGAEQSAYAIWSGMKNTYPNVLSN